MNFRKPVMLGAGIPTRNRRFLSCSRPIDWIYFQATVTWFKSMASDRVARFRLYESHQYFIKMATLPGTCLDINLLRKPHCSAKRKWNNIFIRKFFPDQSCLFLNRYMLGWPKENRDEFIEFSITQHSIVPNPRPNELSSARSAENG